MSIRKRRGGGDPPLDQVAGNGLINRRALLGQGVAFAGTLGAAGALTGAAAEPLTDPQWSLETTLIRIGNEVIGAIGAAGAPGGNLDEACARAGLDKISVPLK